MCVFDMCVFECVSSSTVPVCVYVCARACECACIFVCVCVCVCHYPLFLYVCAFGGGCLSVCMCVYVCVCVCVYVLMDVVCFLYFLMFLMFPKKTKKKSEDELWEHYPLFHINHPNMNVDCSICRKRVGNFAGIDIYIYIFIHQYIYYIYACVYIIYMRADTLVCVYEYELRGGGLGSSTIFEKFHETYAPS